MLQTCAPRAVLLVQVDTREPDRIRPNPFALGSNYVMPPYPPWPDYDAGAKYGPVFIGETPKVRNAEAAT